MTAVYERHAEELAAFFIKGLESGTCKWIRPWNGSSIDSTPYNPTTGHAYRGSNIFALEVQQHRLAAKGADLDDQRWMTYKQAAAIGAQVRRGEKATQLLTWIDPDRTGRNVDETKVASKRLMVMPFAVFHASQIDGLPARPQAVERPLDERLLVAQTLVEQTGAVINHGGGQAYFSPSEDRIQLPHRASFSSDGAYYATAMHELGHWTGHEARLNRQFGRSGTEDYAKEELRAEIASYSISQRLGIPYDPSAHQAYVSSWCRILKDSPKEIMKAASDSERILAFLKVPEISHEIIPKIEQRQDQSLTDILNTPAPVRVVAQGRERGLSI